MHAKTIFFILIFFIAAACFLLSGFILNGYLVTKEKVGTELFSPPEAVYSWKQSEISPFKYRILFSSLVKGTYKLLASKPNENLFYAVYVMWSGITYISAVLAFYYLLLSINFSIKLSFWGGILFLLNPAVIFAFTLPVHTKEDLLGYTILSLALVSIIKRKFLLVLIFTILGVLCRETLLLIPFLYFFFTKETFLYRFLIVGVGFTTLILIRYYMGIEKYDILELGYVYNISNLKESIGFLFLVFNFMWMPFIYESLLSTFKKREIEQTEIFLFGKSGFWVLILVLLTTLFGGRFNEIRLLFIMFPWVIILTLYFVRQNKALIIKALKHRKFPLFAMFTIGIMITVTYLIIINSSVFFPPTPYFVPYNQWVIITSIYITITVLLIPSFINVLSYFNLSRK